MSHLVNLLKIFTATSHSAMMLSQLGKVHLLQGRNSISSAKAVTYLSL